MSAAVLKKTVEVLLSSNSACLAFFRVPTDLAISTTCKSFESAQPAVQLLWIDYLTVPTARCLSYPPSSLLTVTDTSTLEIYV